MYTLYIKMQVSEYKNYLRLRNSYKCDACRAFLTCYKPSTNEFYIKKTR